MRRIDTVLTDLERALWVVDQTGAGKLIDDNSRVSKRGRKRQGLTGRLFLALMIVAAGQGRVTIQRMYDIATGQLPRELQWQLGILRHENGKVRRLSAKQLYDMSERISRHLSWTNLEAQKLPAAERQRRQQAVLQISDALVAATHVIPRAGSSLAVDESGVWAWSVGRAKPQQDPAIDPADEDAELAEKLREQKTQGTLPPPDREDELIDEDRAPRLEATGVQATEPDPRGEATGEAQAGRKPAPLTCPDARWGVKTHKDGSRSSYYGYALHTLVRVPDVINGKADASSEPLFVEGFRLTPASTDVVDVTLDMITQLQAHGPVRDLIGDRHYSYKKFERWALPLWKLGVRPVHDLRKDDHGAVDYNGAKILAGWPHCPGTPQHLERVERPGNTATPQQWDDFRGKIQERHAYSMQRHTSPHKSLRATKLTDKARDSETAKIGYSRWRCPALDGRVGCPLRDGTVTVARQLGLPTVRPPEEPTAFCRQATVQIPPGHHMKYAQEEYWGDEAWERSWNRRTYVEGVFGNLKNPNTENIHRGFFQLVGLPMVTLAMTAAVVSYNIRELNNWHERTGNGDPEHPLLRQTDWVHGFTMLTREDADTIDATFIDDQEAA